MAIEKYYNEIAEGYDELHIKEQEEKWHAIRGYIRVRKKDVLELGCGTGIITEKLQSASRLVAVDISERMIEIARRKGIDAHFLVADAENLPFKDNMFDIVISITMLQDLKNPLKAIQEMRRVGKKAVFSLLAKGRKAEIVRKKYGKGRKAGKDEFWILE